MPKTDKLNALTQVAEYIQGDAQKRHVYALALIGLGLEFSKD